MLDKPKVMYVNDALPTLADMQEFVHGYISQPIRLSDGRSMVVNEEGLLRDLPFNKEATELAQESISPDDYIVGNAIVFKQGVFK